MKPRGEFTLVTEGAAEWSTSEDELDVVELLAAAKARGLTARDAIAEVGRLRGCRGGSCIRGGWSSAAKLLQDVSPPRRWRCHPQPGLLPRGRIDFCSPLFAGCPSGMLPLALSSTDEFSGYKFARASTGLRRVAVCQWVDSTSDMRRVSTFPQTYSRGSVGCRATRSLWSLAATRTALR